MASMTLSFNPLTVGALSKWSGSTGDDGEINYTSPGADGGRVTLTLPEILKGAVFSSARLRYTVRSDKGIRHVRFHGTSIEVSDVNILSRLNAGQEKLSLYFSFKAYGGSGGEGSHSATCEWQNIRLEIEYLPAVGTGGAVTLNGSEIRYRLASKSLKRNESARLMFHISGNLPQSIVFCVDGGEGEAADESMIACSSADIETAFTLKDATWQGRVARARIRIKANFASGAFAGDWEESELRLCAYRLSPSVSCSFTDESQLDARFGGFIEGKSFIKCLISVTLDREADPDVSVSLRSLSFNGASRPLASDECEIGYVPASGSVPYAVSVTDSHGEEGTVSGSVGIIRYASPCLTALVFERYGEGVDEQGNAVYYPDDGSPNIRVTAIGSVSTVNGLNAWTLSVLCSDGESEISALMAQGGDGRGISYAGDRTLFTAALSEQSDWNVTVTLSDCFESVSYRLFLPKADAIFDIEKGGVAVGMRSTGTRLAPLFEVAYPAVFHGDVSFPGIDSGWRQAALQGATEYGDSWRVMVRRVGSMVFMRGAAKLDSALESGAGGSDAGVKRLLTLESEFRPGYPMEFAVVPERSECYMHLRLMPSGALTLYNRSGYTVGPSVLIPLNLSFLKE